jgi:hypothetical protein
VRKWDARLPTLHDRKLATHTVTATRLMWSTIYHKSLEIPGWNINKSIVD